MKLSCNFKLSLGILALVFIFGENINFETTSSIVKYQNLKYIKHGVSSLWTFNLKIN